jgi:hypothetical protein
VPAVRPFDDPTSWLLAANRSGQCGFPSASDMRFDSAGARFLLGLLVVVSLVQAEVLRTPRSSGTLEHDGIERLATHVFVVNIGAGESHSQRDTLAIGIRICRLVPSLARSVGLGPVRSPFGRFDAGAVERGPVPFQPDFVVVIAEHFAMHQLEQASLLPFPESSIAGTAAAELLRNRLPWQLVGRRQCMPPNTTRSGVGGRPLCGSDERVESVLPQSTVGDLSISLFDKSTCSRFGANRNWLRQPVPFPNATEYFTLH